jgi:hypothetical protein
MGVDGKAGSRRLLLAMALASGITSVPGALAGSPVVLIVAGDRHGQLPR